MKTVILAMAEGQSGVLRKLESEVTCPLCLDIFTDPKRLPCEHVYCKQCLRGLGLRSVTGKSISCPECRRDTPIPNNDVANFPTPHQINRLIEMHLKSSTTETATPQQAAATCKLHKSQSLDLYCETCESLVCGHCVINTCGKKKHDYGFIDEMVKKHQADLHRELKPVRKLHLQISSALDTISAMEVELQSKKKEKFQQIESTFDALAEILERERNYFKESVETKFQEKENHNSAKKNEMSKTLEEMESLIHYIEVDSPQRSKPEFLEDIDHTRQRIKDLDTSSRSLQLKPTPSPEMEVELLDPAELEDLCKTRSFTYQKGDILKGHVERLFDLNNIPVEQTTEIPLNLQTQNVKKNLLGRVTVLSELHCHNNSTQTVYVKRVSADKYTLSVTPKLRGRHELVIKYNDRHICGSPLPVYVTIDPQQLAAIRKPQVVEFPQVGGIKFYRGKLFVTKLEEKVFVLDSSTKFTENTIPAPGVCDTVTDGCHIYASDILKNRIVKMDLNGTVIKSTGRTGDGPGEFNFPNGIRLSKDEKLYVCDSMNNRIQVFNKDLSFERLIGENYHFDFPSDLDFDDAGNLYIVNQLQHCIQVLTPQGQHIRNIAKHWSGLQRLNEPVSAAIHSNMIYVTDSRNNRISVFKLTGEFVTTFGEGILTYPECIAIDDNGYIHVSDNRSRLVTF